MRRVVMAALALSGACAAPARDETMPADRAGATADSVARARQDSLNRAQPGYVVDSILPLDEEIRRFSAAAGGRPVDALRGGGGSIEELVASFATALTVRDSARLRALAVSPREFIDLIYPSSPHTTPPLRQSPALTWSQIQLSSGSGYRRLLERLGGNALHIDAVSCGEAVERQGRNRLHTACTVTFTMAAGPTTRGRLFGTIIERDGQFKFVSYANMF